MSRLRLRHFSPSCVQELRGSFIIVTGMHGSGKTTLVRDLAGKLASSVDAAVAVGIDGLVPRHSTFASLGAGVVNRVADAQKERNQELLLVVDTAGDRKVLASDDFRKLVADTRHLTIILTLPACSMLPVQLRPLVTCVFQHAEPQLAIRKALYTNFASFTHAFDDFARILDATTEGFDCLVVRRKAQSRHLDEIFFWYHVDDPERAATVTLVGASLFGASDEAAGNDDSDCRVVDIAAAASSSRAGTPPGPRETTTPATSKEVSLTDWLDAHFESYPGDVLVDFTGEAGNVVRDKVGDWFVPFETIYALWKAEGRVGSDSEVGRELTKAGVHEWVVNLRNDEGKRRTTRVRVGLRRRDET